MARPLARFSLAIERASRCLQTPDQTPASPKAASRPADLLTFHMIVVQLPVPVRLRLPLPLPSAEHQHPSLIPSICSPLAPKRCRRQHV
jgi:hypothetical protein